MIQGRVCLSTVNTRTIVAQDGNLYHTQYSKGSFESMIGNWE